MKSFSKIVFGFLLLALPYFVQAQICCDPDAEFDYAGVGSCFQQEGGSFLEDSEICDPDCPGYIDPCTTIPLDGGLSLLAIAGGGLATAAMRRRREEELLEKEA